MVGRRIVITVAAMAVLIACPGRAQASLAVTETSCEYEVNPIGIGVPQPRLSWKTASDERGVLQAAYQVRCAESPEALTAGRDLTWDTGRVESDRSVHVPYAGPPLRSRERVYWQVRVWGRSQRTQGSRANAPDTDRVSPWSAPAFWELGLLGPGEWSASWIVPDWPEAPDASNPCPMLRKEFVLGPNVRRARAYVTAHGVYRLSLNGRRVGDSLFPPGWTAYDKRLQVQTYDVTDLVQQGRNAVGVTLGDGWYRGRLRQGNRRNLYGRTLGLLLQIEVELEDGTRTQVLTDDSWRGATGPILRSDFYNGETFDARLVRAGWDQPGYDDSAWGRVQARPLRKDHLVAQVGPPVRVMGEVRPVQVLRTPAGQTVVDMGQNMVGWVRLSVRGAEGTRIRLRHAEVLDSTGELYTANLRSAQQVDEYILAGRGVEVLEPHFTFHGFRYVAVEGWPGDLALGDLTGVVIYSGFAQTGTFTCSDPLINRLQENIWWGQRGNFVDIPSDCPQRDERLGWTGDAQVFARTACFNAQVAGFYAKWLQDLEAEQRPDGAVPHVVPDTYTQSGSPGRGGAAGWADAAVIVPWTLYLCYGDERILADQYDSMKAWVDFLAARAGPDCLDDQTDGFGDWLAFHSQSADYPGAATDKDLISQAFFARSVDLLHRTALVLGKAEDAARYADLLARVKRAFCEEFVTPGARLTSSTQTAYALALAFDLMPQDQRPAAALHLAEDVRRRGHITAGFLGTPWVCHALSEHGYAAEAYRLLERKEYPSWLYPITRGATTIWERWDGIKPDGGFQDPTMNSFNHYAYGAIGDWLYRVVAGVEIDEQSPGYKHILFQPHLGGSLARAEARLESPYGRIVSAWTRQDGDVTVDVQVPANTTATVRLPNAWIGQVTESGRSLAQADGLSAGSQATDGVVAEIGSGHYTFRYRRVDALDVQAQPGYVRGSFIYPLDDRPTPQCHASTIAETGSGLVAAWFAGTRERHPDVGIRVSHLNGHQWSAPVEVANGVQPSGERHPCWNPVLFKARSGPLMLFYKVGPSPSTWWGMVMTSEDDGRTWSPPRRLGDGPLGPLCGPVKNKPIQLQDGAILCPSSTESDGWRVHFEITRDLGRTWEVVGPTHDGREFSAIQPTLLVHPGARLQALCRSRQDVVTQTWSEDSGRTWGPMTATSLPNPSSGIDGVTLADGRHLLVYNHTVRNQPFPAARQMLNVALSADGREWKPILILECAEGQYSYPAVIQTSDGLVHTTYTYNRETIKHVVLDPSRIGTAGAPES